MESASDIHGIETYYQTEQSKALADFIHESLVTQLDAPDRSVRRARFYVIKNTPVPAVLAEVGFISNKEERDKLISSDYQKKIAEALDAGVMLYLDRKLTLNKVDKSGSSLPLRTARQPSLIHDARSSYERIAQTQNEENR
jgi:hypothetical protein